MVTNTGSSKYRSPAIMPDGTEFEHWEDETEYSRVYYVDQQHPAATDRNPGTEEAPFLTIQRAAELLEPGEKVLIKSGIYREWIRPKQGGSGVDKMISYEAAPGAEAIVRGSDLLTGEWRLSQSPRRRSMNAWETDLPEEYFAEDRPFSMENASDEDMDVMRWARDVRGHVPFTFRRVIIFEDGRRMTQLATYEDVHRVPGSFWIDLENKKLHVKPFGYTNPNGAEFEATTRQYLLNPVVKGLGYIRINGLIFEHAGNGFPRSGTGAVTTWGGHHWIIEENTVRHINSVGIEIGAFTDEREHTAVTDELKDATGRHIVRRNHVHDCGTGGIQGTVVARSVITNNHIHHCGWQEAEPYWETAGIKILCTLGALVQCNHIHHCYAGPAIWIDFKNRNTRVCRNLAHDISSYHGAIFFEASDEPNMIDHNVVMFTHGSGLYQHDCDLVVIAHNLVVDCDVGIQMLKNKQRDRVGMCENNQVINNVVVDCGVPLDYFDAENVSDHNLIAGAGDEYDLAEWQKRGLDAHSRVVSLDLEFDRKTQILSWLSAADEILQVERDEVLDCDYFGRAHPVDQVPVGPFIEGWSKVRRQLRMNQG